MIKRILGGVLICLRIIECVSVMVELFEEVEDDVLVLFLEKMF